MTIRDKIFGMSGFASEVLRCLFFHGPTLDGDVPSKEGRSELVRLGYADRGHGYNWLTSAGVEFAIQSMDMGVEKERWDNARRNKAG